MTAVDQLSVLSALAQFEDSRKNVEYHCDVLFIWIDKSGLHVQYWHFCAGVVWLLCWCQLCISHKMSGLDLDKIHEVLTSCQTLARCWFPRTGLSLNEKFNWWGPFRSFAVHLVFCTLSVWDVPKTYVFCAFSDIESTAKSSTMTAVDQHSVLSA